MKECKNKLTFLEFITHHSYAIVWVGLYVLMILAGIRFDLLVSLISSTVVITAMFLVHRIVKLWLIPLLLNEHRQWVYYSVSLVSIFFITYSVMHLEFGIFMHLVKMGHLEFPEEATRADMMFPFFKNFFLLLSTFVVTTVSYLLTKNKISAESNARLRSEKLDMELRYLKAQINPHFLFNALNNIYALVYTGDENAPESILKLSEMLRYVTDDCQANTISLDKELKYIDNYIDFQLMRMEEARNVIFDKKIEMHSLQFPPMIFQPLIENCFKYARLEADRTGYIRITIEQKGNRLVFTAENTIASTHLNKPTKRDGVGLLNVKKRLNLAFGSNYDLKVENNSHIYKTILNIQLA